MLRLVYVAHFVCMCARVCVCACMLCVGLCLCSCTVEEDGLCLSSLLDCSILKQEFPSHELVKLPFVSSLEISNRVS